MLEVFHLAHPLKESLYTREPHVMALGFFDGVHLGHQSLLKQAKSIAEKNKLKFTAMTFDPHPNEVIKLEKDWRYLTPLALKIERMAAIGVDKLFVIKFNLSFASLQPSDFIKQYVLGLQAKHIVVGFDFTFGNKAQGTVDYLQKVSKYNPFDVTVISKQVHNDEKISSTLIRKIVSDGDVHLVPCYLGHHFEIKGFVFNSNRHKHEKKKNMVIYIENKYILPRPGIYSVEIKNKNKTCHGLFIRYGSSKRNDEISGQIIEWLKGGVVEELTVKFIKQIPFESMAQYS
ncbi:FAD synthetase family protein [Peribacillus simplex]|uniref:FAD synthase n=2 Tax=Peribacillus TaxID=2675229 RepID=A0AA90T2J8_9BACI|nr:MULTISPECIES: FAD synthetase family protein [Peribacillus]MDP1418925.1 FAD synthetase family protein [Peribacillus simplex]MDP1451618.1 FAD synthetase family protein [Peribacillus frigoritolerans]